jgi:TPR repeat protein
MTVLLVSQANAATEPAAYDAPPVLVSTKGHGPKWSNVAQLRQFAAQGDPQACLELGGRFLEGDGVPQDTAGAINLLEKAAAAGLPDALFRLGKIYHDGLGVPVDYRRALGYFIPAAQANVMEAQHNIGAMLVSARGVKRNVVEGLAWLIVASHSGDSSEAEARVRAGLAQRPTAIKTAEVRAAEILRDLPHATVAGVTPPGPAPLPAAPEPEKPKPVLTPEKPPAVEVPAITAPELPPITPPDPSAPTSGPGK